VTVAKVAKKPAPKRTSKQASAKKASAKRATAPHEDDGVCGCDVEITDADATADADLPAARGGVEVVRAQRR
jgi:hypothetical protein